MMWIGLAAGLGMSLGAAGAMGQAGADRLAAATRIECRFPLVAEGTWNGANPAAEAKPADLHLEFEAINADEGTAQLASAFGAYDIIVRYAGGYLHFIQSFFDGPLHVTTVLDREAGPGKLRAVQSRHEATDFALPGFTSSPEQYYGECEVFNE
jgi:hypothetical protein